MIPQGYYQHGNASGLRIGDKETQCPYGIQVPEERVRNQFRCGYEKSNADALLFLNIVLNIGCLLFRFS